MQPLRSKGPDFQQKGLLGLGSEMQRTWRSHGRKKIILNSPKTKRRPGEVLGVAQSDSKQFAAELKLLPTD